MTRHKIIFFGTFGYFGVITTVLFSHNLWFSPDQFIIAAVLVAVFLGRGKQFIHDWLPFIVMFLGYEALRGINPEMTKIPVNILNVIGWEKFLFLGNIPTLVLQHAWYNPTNIRWYDVFLSVVYMAHFATFLLFALFLWIKKHVLFQNFTYTILFLSYCAFLTFIVFPVMPPWMASDKNYLPKVERIMYQTTPVYTTPTPGHIPTVYDLFAANKTAAIPSLHAAYPLVIFLFSLLLKKKLLITLSLTYTLLVWLAVVYLGEHYVVDVIAGALYALISFFVVSKF